MPFRRVPQQSDRGSIRDIANGDDEKFPPTSEELRLKSLYEYGLATKDQCLIDSLGLIVINGAPKDPISIFRHKEYVDSLKKKMANQIQQMSNELAICFDIVPSNELRYIKARQENARENIQSDEEWTKTASFGTNRSSILVNSFRRVR